ncbi:hypothetical protein BJQ96_01149 [Flavobacterium sp. PL0002]|nr:hypothetical protein [Flavobacterium sp. PL002]
MIVKCLKILLLLIYGYFAYLLFLITIQYVPLNFDVAFLRIKQDEIGLLHYRWAFFIHVYTSIFLIAVGWMQFSTYLRTHYKQLHRIIGKFYVLTLLFLSGPSGLIMSYYANGGLVAKISFITLSVLWIVMTYVAYYYARKGDFVKHKKYAVRSFALTLSAISLRLFKYIIVFLFHPLPMDTYRIVSWLGWAFNLILAEIILFYWFKNKINGIKT